MTTLADLTAAALKLSETDREALADALLDSLPDEYPHDCPDGVLSMDDPAYDEEIGRRVEAVQNGTADLLSVEEAMRYIMSDDEDDDADG